MRYEQWANGGLGMRRGPPPCAPMVERYPLIFVRRRLWYIFSLHNFQGFVGVGWVEVGVGGVWWSSYLTFASICGHDWLVCSVCMGNSSCFYVKLFGRLLKGIHVGYIGIEDAARTILPSSYLGPIDWIRIVRRTMGRCFKEMGHTYPSPRW